MFIDHPLLKKGAIEEREYQVNVAKECAEESTLVVLPTGLGKTIVALLVIADVLQKEGGRILLMAPTKPLVDQHTESLTGLLEAGPVAIFTGEIHPEKREESWKTAKIIVSTPQVIENDIDSGIGSLKDFSLVIFDEAHRAVGDYSYVKIGTNYMAQREGAHVLGMTASPGHDLDKVAEVCKNLGMTNIAVRSEFDEDVAPYVFGIKLESVKVDLSEETDEITALLDQIFEEKVEMLRKYHLLDDKRRPGTRDLLTVGKIIQAKVSGNPKNFHLYRAWTIQSAAIKVNHAIDLAQTQGREALSNYIGKIINEAQEKKGKRASKDLVKDARFEMVRRILDTSGAEHPKHDKVKEIVAEQLCKNPDSRVIVFTHYRDTCDIITELLATVPSAKPVRFVGQASKGNNAGLKQREQKEIIEQFKNGEFNVLVATSVAEEGLDIPSTDLVVFYEPIPSEIRTIQRRGRTGRHSPGRVVVLLARETKDEAYLYSSKRKERKMRVQLDSLSRRLRVAKRMSATTGEEVDVGELVERSAGEAEAENRASHMSKSQTLLSDFGALASSGLKLYANRPKNREILDELRGIGIAFDEARTPLEDFVIGDEVAIIRESIDKFLVDIEGPDLTTRSAALKDRYRRPMIIVEGGSAKKKDVADKLPIYDVMSSLLRRLKVPVMPTADPKDTAAFIASLIKLEMQRRSITSKSDAGAQVSEYQKRMIQGLPNVTSVVAERLLERFGSVQSVLTASTEELMTVDGVGKVIAEGIRKISAEKYRSGRTMDLDSF